MRLPGTTAGPNQSPIHLDAADVTILMACHAKLSGGLKVFAANHMVLHVEGWASEADRFAWTVEVPSATTCEVTALVAGSGATIEASGAKSAIRARTDGEGWSRVHLGALDLPSGTVALSVRLSSAPHGPPLSLHSLQLVRPETAVALAQEAKAYRASTAWFADAAYGLMCHWTTRNPPRHGPNKPWPQDVEDFAVSAFAEMAQQTGAGYVLFTSTWGPQYVPAPIQSIEALLPGRTSQRDLIGDLADALRVRGLRLMLYYHSGYPCYHATDEDWWRAVGGDRADKTAFFTNWCAIIAEMSERYGDRVAGWFFDGAQRYYDPHFDGTPTIGPNHAPWQQMTRAAKAGHPARIVGYNSWIHPKFTDFQDYFCGEGYRAHDELPAGGSGIFAASHAQAGLQAHTCFPLEDRWGHITPDTEIGQPVYDEAELCAMIRDGIARRNVLSINLQAYEDGTMSSASLSLMHAVRRAVRGA